MTPPRPARRDEELTTALLRESTDSITALIEERLPLMFGAGDLWGPVAQGFLARTGTLQESLTVMVERGMPGEAQMLLRILFEHVTTFCWLAIDPESHVKRWRQWADSRQLKVHNEAKRFGLKVLTDDEVAAYAEAEEAMPTLQLAEAVDRHWSEVSSAFRSLKAPKGSFPSVLTFTGFYTSVYRKASTLVHADMASADRFLTMPLKHHATVHLREKHAHSNDHPTISVAFVGFQLIVLGIKFGWPQESITRAITDHLHYRDEDEDGA
jgi:hypothetical protein